MKKILTALSFLALLNTSTAQTSIQVINYSASLTVQPNGIITRTTTPDSTFKTTLDIKNTSASTQSYTAKRYDVKLNSTATRTAEAFFCFAGLCYGASTDSSVATLVLASQQKASELPDEFNMLEADLDEIDVIGYSLIKYSFMNINNAADTVSVFIQYNDITTGITVSTEAPKFKLYPNPVSDGIVNIYSPIKFQSAEVINILGEVVITERTQSVENNRIDMRSLPKGTYFVRLRSGDKVLTEKVILTK